jgi:hypothetical protein
MNLIDLATFVLSTSLVMIIFVAKTNLEKSKVRVKAKRNPKQ